MRQDPSWQAEASAQELNTTGQQLNATNADFLKIDVQTGLTFAALALDTSDQEKKVRNRDNARKAYDAILRLKVSVIFTGDQEAYLREMMNRLKNDLELLGETF